jgi:hypothetical protein
MATKKNTPLPPKNTKKIIKKPIIQFKKKGNKNKKKNFKPIIILLIISLVISLLLPYIKDNQKFSDTPIALNLLEQKFKE